MCVVCLGCSNGELGCIRGWTFRWRCSIALSSERPLESWRRDHRRDDDHGDDSGEDGAINDRFPAYGERLANVREDQADFTARHHANADREPIDAFAGSQRTSLFANDRRDREGNGEQRNAGLRKCQQIGTHAHQHEEHRNQERGDRLDQVFQRRFSAGGEIAEVQVFENQAGGKSSHDGREANDARKPREHEANGETDREQYASSLEFRGDVEKSGADLHAEEERSHEERSGLGEDDADVAVVHRSASIGSRDDPRDDGQDHEPEHVVDDRSAKDDPRFGALRFLQILKNPRGNANARGRERSSEKCVNVDAGIGQQPHAEEPSQDKRSDDAEKRHDEALEPHLHHLSYRRFEPDLEQQQEHAQTRQHVDARVLFHRFEPMQPDDAEVAENDPSYEFAKHSRLSKTNSNVAAKFGRNQDDREVKHDRGNWIGMRGARGERYRGNQ